MVDNPQAETIVLDTEVAMIRDEIKCFDEWLKSAGEIPGVSIIELWDAFQKAKDEPSLDDLPQFHKPQFMRKEAT